MADPNLEAYFALLRKWNRAIRLTGAASDEALQLHAAEARALLPHLPERGRVVDVGSGSGFPAIPIALWRRDLELVLLEPVAKKAAFLRTCRRTLGLSNVEVRRERDEEHRAATDFEPYDAAISQATFAPATWIERGTLLVRPSGVVLVMLAHDDDGLPPDLERHGASIQERARSVGVFHVKR